MADSNKRKERSGNDKAGQDNRDTKRSKGGSGGKWLTPHQKEQKELRGSGKIEPGDVGIWVTCARGQEGRATTELRSMFEECAERFYGLRSEPDADEDEGVDDIEASIQKEVASMGDKNNAQTKLFSPVHLDIQCVLFFKTRHEIDPVDFVHRICEEIVKKPGVRRMKYANRLTPVSMIGKATEKGLEEVGKTVLGKHFKLAGEGEAVEEGEEKAVSSYAIRPTIRNHSSLTRSVVINQTAEMIDNVHKVNLTSPDKTIILELFQTVLGMSVVGSDWDELKRFNLAELYSAQKKAAASAAESSKAELKSKTVKVEPDTEVKVEEDVKS